MNAILIILLVLAMVFVVVSLVRGIVAFLQSHKADIESGGARQKEMLTTSSLVTLAIGRLRKRRLRSW